MPSKMKLSRLFGRPDKTRNSRNASPEGTAAASESTATTNRLTTRDSPAASAPSSLPEQLWIRAYDALKAEDASLVRDYEKILSRELDTSAQTTTPNTLEQDHAARQAQLRGLIQAGLKRTEREARVKQGVGDAVAVVLSVKGIVDSAVQAVPQAALAWTGVCLALGMLVHPATATETNRKGIVYVVTRMDWYWNLASILLKENTADGADGAEGLRHELERRIVNLYEALLSYQMTSVCSYYRNRGLEFLRDAVRLDDWDGSLARVHDAEGALRQDSAEYNTQQVISRLDRIASAAESIETKLLDPSSQSGPASGPQKRPWAVPFGRNRDFVGRESLLAQLLERIPPSADEQDCQRTAVEGLGGVGKTQLALEAAFRVREKHDCAVFWVPAVDAATFENAYREIGRQLGIREIGSSGADVKSLVKTALSQSADSWLLVVDNADDIELFFGTTGTPLCDFLPFSLRGSILFTTRTHAAVRKLDIPRANVIRPTELSRPEAFELLGKNVAADQMADAGSTTKLLDFLADLPLAIRQASAYMDQTGITTSQYLEHCQSNDMSRIVRLLGKDFDDRGRYKNIQNPIITTWLISFQHISRDSPQAAECLRFISFLSEKEIPKSLLFFGDDQLEADEVIGSLKAYAFITERAGQDSYDMHKLVRLAIKNWLAEKGELQECFAKAIQRLDQVFPTPAYERFDVMVKYLPHMLAALQHQQDSANPEALSNLLTNAGEANYAVGRWGEAEDILRQALELRKKALGPEHPQTLTSMQNLAFLLNERRSRDEAEQIHRQAFELRKKVLGADHPETLMSMTSVASMISYRGNYEDAEQMLRQTLELWKGVPGAELRDMFTSMNQLANVLQRQGKYDEAEHMHRQTLELRKKVLGAKHIDTLNSINNLGSVLHDQGNREEAERMYRQAIEFTLMALGGITLRTLPPMHNLAIVLEQQGKHEEAEQMFRQVLTLKQELLGVEHPDTLTTMFEFPTTLDSLGKHQEAEEMRQRAQEAWEKQQ